MVAVEGESLGGGSLGKGGMGRTWNGRFAFLVLEVSLNSFP